MNKYEQLVLEFHELYDCPINQPLSSELLTLRKRLLQEELDEFKVEVDSIISKLDKGEKVDRDSYIKMIHELADIQYVLSGFAVSFGIDLEQIFELIHKSNLSKLGEDGKPIKRADGKILKGPNFHLPKYDSIKW